MAKPTTRSAVWIMPGVDDASHMAAEVDAEGAALLDKRTRRAASPLNVPAECTVTSASVCVRQLLAQEQRRRC